MCSSCFTQLRSERTVNVRSKMLVEMFSDHSCQLQLETAGTVRSNRTVETSRQDTLFSWHLRRLQICTRQVDTCLQVLADNTCMQERERYFCLTRSACQPDEPCWARSLSGLTAAQRYEATKPVMRSASTFACIICRWGLHAASYYCLIG